MTVLGSHLWACSERCFPQVPREQGRRDHVCVRHENVISLRCVIACEVLVAAMSQKSFIIKIKCFFLLWVLFYPLFIVFYCSSAMFLFSLSPFDVVLCVVLHPYFLFLIVAFFSHAGLYSFSFPKDFSFLSLVICCTAWPRSI